MKYPYLNDQSVLEYVYSLDVSRIMASVFILDQNDSFIQAIDGYITGGSISINGNSVVRRTGSLSLVTDPFADEEVMLHEVSNIKNLISLNKRISIEVGIENIGIEYPDIDIFWFPMGIYTISNPSISHDASGIKITLKLNDKMALLNGTEGGTIPIETILSPYEDRTSPVKETIIDANGNATIITKYQQLDVPMIEVVQDIITEFSEVSQSQIIVENIPQRIRNKVSWKGQLESETDATYKTLYVYKKQKEGQWLCSLTKPEAYYEMHEFHKGDTVGYYYTDFTYPGKLASTRNDNVASILTKIKDKLGNFEFFFDTEGLFHFREMRNFLNQGSPEEDLLTAIDDKYILSVNSDQDKTVYDFTDGKYIISYANNPNYTKVKNDITVWVTGNEDKLPRRYHLIIDAPEPMHWYRVEGSNSTIDGKWRATDVQMDPEDGANYYPDDRRTNLYLYFLAQKQIEEKAGIRNGIGNSKLAKELIEFWPTIYNVAEQRFYTEDFSTFDYYFDIIDVSKIRYNRDVAQLAIQEIGNRPLVLEDKSSNCLFAKDTALDLNFISENNSSTIEYTNSTKGGEQIDFEWNTEANTQILLRHIEVLYQEYNTHGILDCNYEWTDITPDMFPWYSEPIGSGHNADAVRLCLKSINNQLIAQLVSADSLEVIPSTILTDKEEVALAITYSIANVQESIDHGEDFVVAPADIYDHLALGEVKRPASEYVRSILHEYLGYNNSINITGVPLYHLDVNSRISVEDDASDIHGDYIIQSINMPLDPSGKMTITATKAIERI